MRDIFIVILFILIAIILVFLVYCSNREISTSKVESFVSGENSEEYPGEEDDGEDDEEETYNEEEEDNINGEGAEESEESPGRGRGGSGKGKHSEEEQLPHQHHFSEEEAEDEPIHIEDELHDSGKNLFTNNSFSKLSNGRNDILDDTHQPFPGLKNTGSYVQVGQGNPGTSNYVLKLDQNESYTIPDIKVKSGRKYVVKLWERHTQQLNNNFFKVSFHGSKESKSSSKAEEVHSQGMRKETTVINGYTWNSLEFIFTTPKSCRTIELSLQNIDTNKDFMIDVTNLGLFEYVNPIENFPLYHKIAFYLTSLLASSYRPQNGRMWLDQTDSGKDFLFSRTPKYDKRVVNLYDNSPLTIIGPPGHDLHILFDNGFSIGWTGYFDANPGSYILFYSHIVSNSKQEDFTVSLAIKNKKESQLTVKIGSNHISWSVGRVDVPSAYLLGFNTSQNKISLYKETQDKFESKTINNSKKNSIGNIINSHMQFTNFPLVINPPKQNSHLKGILYQYYAYNQAFSDQQANKINHFMYRRCCEHAPISEEEEPIHHEEHSTPAPTPTPSSSAEGGGPDDPTPFEEDEGGHAHYSHHQSSGRGGGGGGYQNQNVEVIISGDLTRNKDVANAQKTIKSLVRAFNAREKDDDEKNPAEKVEYNVRPDGRVVRRVYRRKQIPGEEKNTCQL